jgi:hypothetical protein
MLSNERGTIKFVTEYKLILHRMPYMKMDKRVQNKVNMILFILLVLVGINLSLGHFVYEVFSSLVVSLTIFVYPGIFYFLCYVDLMKKEIKVQNEPKQTKVKK